MSAPSKLILLHPDDNIFIVTQSIAENEALVFDGERIIASQAIAIGHKVARTALMKHMKILRYGAPIGSLTTSVSAGDHVHLHNLKSDYIATHNRETATDKRHETVPQNAHD